MTEQFYNEMEKIERKKIHKRIEYPGRNMHLMNFFLQFYFC